jgi:tRNA modification GTPase
MILKRKVLKLSLNRAEEADLKLVVVDAKKLDFTDVLKGLLRSKCNFSNK